MKIFEHLTLYWVHAVISDFFLYCFAFWEYFDKQFLYQLLLLVMWLTVSSEDNFEDQIALYFNISQNISKGWLLWCNIQGKFNQISKLYDRSSPNMDYSSMWISHWNLSSGSICVDNNLQLHWLVGLYLKSFSFN